MVKLNVERLNRHSSYRVSKIRGNSFAFTTDSGIHYVTTFDTDNLLESCKSYQFSLINIDDKSSPRDLKLRDTVAAIILEFFVSNTATLLYLCETSDGRQRLRNRLFTTWFRNVVDNDEFIFKNAEVVDMEGISNYVSIIFRKDNPHTSAIIREWEETVTLLSHKPHKSDEATGLSY